MHKTVNEYHFIAEFESIRPENFSRPALRTLFEYLTELEEDLGESIELDVIALCCDWAEYTRDELAAQFPELWREDEDAMLYAFRGKTYITPLYHHGGEYTYLMRAF